ncbi:phage tail protein [Anaeromusa acidaminophila]|uniref:phage tail protein n=1 Tax=Anaeromusa acidaminophila TaxID=81464 RepID=UPI003BEEE9A6
MWPSFSNPTDGNIWLECNGQSTSAYPALAAIVGVTVPDYRGIFLRGYGSQTSMHYGTITHSSASINQLQGDSIREIYATSGGAYEQTPSYYLFSPLMKLESCL